MTLILTHWEGLTFIEPVRLHIAEDVLCSNRTRCFRSHQPGNTNASSNSIASLISAVSSLVPPKTTTQLISLTTVFTSPSWCSKLQLTFFGDNGAFDGLTSTFWKDPGFPSNDSRQISLQSCYPPHFTYQPDLFATDGFVYSPGVCPSGYFAAKSNGLYGQTTAAATSWCCPRYTPHTNSGAKDRTNNSIHTSSGMTFSAFQGCISLTTPTATTTLYEGQPIQMSQPYYILEPYIPVAWASSDLALFTPTSAPLSLAAQCKRLANVSRTSVTSTDPAKGGQQAVKGASGVKEKGGFSKAAKIGTGVGISVAAIAAAVVAVLVLKYRRKRRATALGLKARDTVELKNGVGISEVDADSRAEADFEHYRAEADSTASLRRELDSRAIRAEADGSSLRHELDSGWYGHEK